MGEEARRSTAGPESTACVQEGVDLRGALIDEGLGALDDGAGGIDHVVDEEALLALDVADDVHDFHDVRLGAALVDDRHRAVEALGDLARTVDRTDVGRDDDEVLVHLVFKVAVKERAAEKVIDGDIEKALDLRGVEVHREDAVGAGGGEKVGNELCRDGIARAGLAVLTGIAEVRDDRRHAACRSALCRIDHDEQLHEVIV